MKLSSISYVVLGVGMFACAIWAKPLAAATPTPEQALRLMPVQKGIDFDQPNKEEIGKYKLSAYKVDGQVGWVVEAPDGDILRRFIDTNGDNMVDQWCYFKDGVEVYRDIDSDFNGKADQYRWFHTGGTRWALDKNEDNEIDSWKSISPEEVSAEIVAALANQDPARFARVTLSSKELEDLGLGETRSKQVAEKLENISAEFTKLAAQQKAVTAATKWVQFSGGQPGTIPAGTEGSTADVTAFENVTAIIETEGKHGQVQIGTLVQVGDTWRAITVPNVLGDSDSQVAGGGFFFHAPNRNKPQTAAGAPSDEAQKLIDALTELDKKGSSQPSYHSKRADLLAKIADAAASPEEKEMWVRQMADGISAAVQSGAWPEGVDRLEALFKRLEQIDATSAAAYVRFRQLFSDYGLKMAAPKADLAKVQAEWLKNLEEYVKEYPKSVDAAEAMLQLAMNNEFAGQEDAAKKWYSRIAKEFSDTPAGRKSAGAMNRLGCVGKVLDFQGRNPKGETVDLAKFRGRVVLLQYWATWCEPCKTDLAVLKELATKYGKSGLTIVGVSLDAQPQDLASYLGENPLPWPQIFEEGGLDSRPANALGIFNLPTMILIDRSGKVLDRNIRVTELDGKLKELLR